MCVSLHVPMLSSPLKHNSVHHSPFHTSKQPTLPPASDHSTFKHVTIQKKHIMLCLLSKERKNIYISCNYYHSISPYIHISPSHILHSPTAFGPSWPNTCPNRNKGPKYETKRKLRGAQGPHERNKLRIVTMPDMTWQVSMTFWSQHKFSAQEKKWVFFFWGGGPSWETFKGEWCVFFWLFFGGGGFVLG